MNSLRDPVGDGGADRDRTDDLVIANDALSQLSYGPNARLFGGFRPPSQAAAAGPDARHHTRGRPRHPATKTTAFRAQPSARATFLFTSKKLSGVQETESIPAATSTCAKSG